MKIQLKKYTNFRSCEFFGHSGLDALDSLDDLDLCLIRKFCPCGFFNLSITDRVEETGRKICQMVEHKKNFSNVEDLSCHGLLIEVEKLIASNQI